MVPKKDIYSSILGNILQEEGSVFATIMSHSPQTKPGNLGSLQELMIGGKSET